MPAPTAFALAAIARSFALLSPLEGGTGGAPLFTALMMPVRMVCARLGWGGGDEDELIAVVAVAADDGPAPAPNVEPVSKAAPAPEAKPLTPETSAPAAAAPARSIEKADEPTSPEINRFAINGIKPSANA